MTARLLASPVYLAAIAAAFVFNVANGADLRGEDLVRPLLIAVAVALAIQAVPTAISRDLHIGAVLALPIVLALTSLGPLAPIVIGASAGMIALGVRRRQHIRDLPWERATRLLNVIAVAVLLVAASQAIADGVVRPPGGSQSSTAARAGPDIWVILLDGYPRADTLAGAFGVDNRPFLADLESLGFEVASASHSNYNMTALTLMSMLNMAQVGDVISEPPPEGRAQARAIREAIRNGRALDALRQAGFEIVVAPSAFTWLMPDADRTIAASTVTDFEFSLLWASGLRAILAGPVGALALDAHRSGIDEDFASLADLARERGSRPRFVLAHIMAPHPPYVLGGQSPWPCYPNECTLWDPGHRYGTAEIARRLAPQLASTNQLVTDLASEIIRSDPESVVAILSDHGHRHDPDDLDESLRSFFAVRAPGHPGLFGDSPTPINLVPRILNAYVNAGLPLATEESYVVDLRDPDSAPLKIRAWPVGPG